MAEHDEPGPQSPGPVSDDTSVVAPTPPEGEDRAGAASPWWRRPVPYPNVVLPAVVAAVVSCLTCAAWLATDRHDGVVLAPRVCVVHQHDPAVDWLLSVPKTHSNHDHARTAPDAP